MEKKYTFEQFQAEMKHKNLFLQKIDVFYPNDQYVSENIPSDETDVITIRMCVFYIEYSCLMPFVKYAVRINEGKISFPEFSFNFSEEHLENVFIKSCDEQLVKIFRNEQSGGFPEGSNESSSLMSGGKLTGKIQSSFGKCYRGFIPKNNSIYVFYDVTSLLLNDNKLNPDFKYAIADELSNVKSIFGNLTDNSITKLFKPDKSFPISAILNPWFIKSSGSLKSITIPLVGYLCMTDDDGETFYTLTQEQINQKSVISDCLIDPQEVGSYYFFSTKVLNPQSNASYIRHAFFTMKMRDWTGSKFPNKRAYNYEDDINTVMFKLDSKTMIYGLKSPDQFVAF
jgi:hypothetical protein